MLKCKSCMIQQLISYPTWFNTLASTDLDSGLRGSRAAGDPISPGNSHYQISRHYFVSAGWEKRGPGGKVEQGAMSRRSQLSRYWKLPDVWSVSCTCRVRTMWDRKRGSNERGAGDYNSSGTIYYLIFDQYLVPVGFHSNFVMIKIWTRICNLESCWASLKRLS